MVAKYILQPNEFVILPETTVERGTSAHSNELELTNQNLICTSKGMFGNVKNVLLYPVNQIKRVNGKPQVRMRKSSGGYPTLEISFANGTSESFRFVSNERTVREWITEINKLFGVNEPAEEISKKSENTDALAGAFKEFGSQIKDAGTEFFGALGLKSFGKASSHKSTSHGASKINAKCKACAAPLTGNEGQTVKCQYCDTEQTL